MIQALIIPVMAQGNDAHSVDSPPVRAVAGVYELKFANYYISELGNIGYSRSGGLTNGNQIHIYCGRNRKAIRYRNEHDV